MSNPRLSPPTGQPPSQSGAGFPFAPVIYSSTNDLGRYDFMSAGHVYNLDFLNMEVVDITPAATLATLPNTQPTPTVRMNADPRLRGRVRSIMIFASDADTLINVNNAIMFNDHSLFHIINDLSVLSVQVTAPENKIPPVVDLQFVITNVLIMTDAYVKDLQLAHTKKFYNNIASAATWVDVLRIHIGGYDQLTVQLDEVGGTHGVQWQVLVSEDDVNYSVLTGVTFSNIAANGYALFTTNVKWHFYRIQIHDITSGQHGTIDMSSSPIR